jgi:DNA adenine methylase
VNSGDNLKFIRYPGGKQRQLSCLMPYLPNKDSIKGLFVEPFVGGGAVFFGISPHKALLADINPTLIDLYRGIRRHPLEVWKFFKRFPSTRKGYYKIRDSGEEDNLAYRAARTLYLNRTCFKGMWRENSSGQFNVGYGGQDRRWVVNQCLLLTVSMFLKRAKLRTSDFEETIDSCKEGDFLFLDPPYRPGAKELKHNHYVYSKFTFEDYRRLSNALKKVSKRKVKWAMTTSSHKDIVALFKGNRIIPFIKGTGKKPGELAKKSREVLICNY